MWTALKDDVLTPLIGPVLDSAIRQGNGEVMAGGGRDRCENMDWLLTIQVRASHCSDHVMVPL